MATKKKTGNAKKQSPYMRDKIAKEIKEKTEELMEDYKDIPQSRQRLAREMVESLAFCSVNMKYLEKDLLEEGFTQEYTNGKNQKGLKDNAKMAVYNKMFQRKESCVKVLTKMIPEETPDQGNSLQKFVDKKK